jgi:hypothetical protein
LFEVPTGRPTIFCRLEGDYGAACKRREAIKGLESKGAVVIKVPRDIAQFDIGYAFDPPQPALGDSMPLKKKRKR